VFFLLIISGSSMWNFFGVTSTSESENKSNPSVQNLSNACKLGNVKLLKALLSDKSKQVNAGEHNNSPIRLASEFGHSNIVEILLADKRVDPSALDNQVCLITSYDFI
jgi:ankyrin repeat protein